MRVKKSGAPNKGEVPQQRHQKALSLLQPSRPGDRPREWKMAQKQISGRGELVCWGRAWREKIWCRHSNRLSPAPPEAHSALSCRNTFLIKAYKSCFVRTSPHPIDFKMVNQASSPFDAPRAWAMACTESVAVAAAAAAAAEWVVSSSHLMPGMSQVSSNLDTCKQNSRGWGSPLFFWCWMGLLISFTVAMEGFCLIDGYCPEFWKMAIFFFLWEMQFQS